MCQSQSLTRWLLLSSLTLHPAKKTASGTGTKCHLAVLVEAEFSNACLHQGLRSNSKMEVCQCCRHLPLSPCCNIVSHHLALHSLQMQHLMVSSFPSSLFSPISCLQSFNQTPIPSQLNNQEKAEPTDQRLSGNITNLS